MKLDVLAGATSRIWQVFVADSSSTTGAGLAGLAFNTASLTAYYHRDTDTTATAITLATMTVGTFTSSGFKEIDATNMPGWYQFCPPNAAITTGAKHCAFHLKGATNMAPLPFEARLVLFDPDTAPATAPTNWSSQVIDSNGRVDVSKIGGIAISALPGVPKNTALANFEFYMVQSGDHITPGTGLTVTATRSIDGAAFGACANAVAEVSAGFYKINLATTDLNGDVVSFKFTATGADPTCITIKTQS